MEKIKILPQSKYPFDIEPDPSINKNQLLLSALTYLDFDKIVSILEKNKIVLTLDHFYTFMYAFVLNKTAIYLCCSRSTGQNSRGYYMKNQYRSIDFLHTDAKLHNQTLWNSDFNCKFLKDELDEIIKAFAKIGFVFTKEVKIIFQFLGMDDATIKHLYNLSKEEENVVRQFEGDKYVEYMNYVTRINHKVSKKKNFPKNINGLIEKCKTSQQEEIFKFMNANPKIKINEDCLKSSLYNYNAGVFEYFHRFGYVPSLFDINCINRMEQRFLLLMRFYPEQCYCKLNSPILTSINDYLENNILDQKEVKPTKKKTKVLKKISSYSSDSDSE